MLREVVVTGIGAVCGLGNTPAEISAALSAGKTSVRPAGDHRDELPVPGFCPAKVDVRPLLKRRKDRKLLPRAAELAIVAAHSAMGEHRAPEVGLFLGVGREPPDEGETEHALVVSMLHGKLDPDLLNGPGRAAYPPLASLRTLPNLVLAHVAIQLGCTGAGGTRAGGAGAGLTAVIEGVRAVAEGRCEVVLTGAADSGIDAGTARDLVRLGEVGAATPPGEGAALIRLETRSGANARGATIMGSITHTQLRTVRSAVTYPVSPHIGWLGAAGAVLDLVLALEAGRDGALSAEERSGCAGEIQWVCGTP